MVPRFQRVAYTSIESNYAGSFLEIHDQHWLTPSRKTSTCLPLARGPWTPWQPSLRRNATGRCPTATDWIMESAAGHPKSSKSSKSCHSPTWKKNEIFVDQWNFGTMTPKFLKFSWISKWFDHQKQLISQAPWGFHKPEKASHSWARLLPSGASSLTQPELRNSKASHKAPERYLSTWKYYEIPPRNLR